jgi:hypothetical protein
MSCRKTRHARTKVRILANARTFRHDVHTTHTERTATQPEQFTHVQLPSPQRLRRVMESGTASPLAADAPMASVNSACSSGSSSGCMYSAGLCLRRTRASVHACTDGVNDGWLTTETSAGAGVHGV